MTSRRRRDAKIELYTLNLHPWNPIRATPEEPRLLMRAGGALSFLRQPTEILRRQCSELLASQRVSGLLPRVDALPPTLELPKRRGDQGGEEEREQAKEQGRH